MRGLAELGSDRRCACFLFIAQMLKNLMTVNARVIVIVP